jgi:hypothetical protein
MPCEPSHAGCDGRSGAASKPTTMSSAIPALISRRGALARRIVTPASIEYCLEQDGQSDRAGHGSLSLLSGLHRNSRAALSRLIR